MLHHFSWILQTEILSTETLDFLKSFNFVTLVCLFISTVKLSITNCDQLNQLEIKYTALIPDICSIESFLKTNYTDSMRQKY